MAFEIKSATNAPVANNVSIEKPAVNPATSQPQSSHIASGQGYSITSVESKRSENFSGGPETGNSKEPTEKKVRETIKHANSELKHAKTGLNFKYHEATRRVSITVYDKDTDEVIREIPPEKSLDMLEKMWELAGMVVDDRG